MGYPNTKGSRWIEIHAHSMVNFHDNNDILIYIHIYIYIYMCVYDISYILLFFCVRFIHICIIYEKDIYDI